MPTKEEKTLAMLIYLISFFFPLLGPLVIWLMKKDESEYIDYHAKEYFNFLISYTVYIVVSSLLTVVIIGFILLPAVSIACIIFTVIAAIKANDGDKYRVPGIFRIIK